MRRPLRAVAPAPAALLLSGCLFVASPPDREYPEPDADVPARWTGADVPPGPVAPGWLETFGNPALAAAVAEAVARNHDLAAAAARIDAAAAEARIAGADAWPQLGAGFSASRQKQNYIGLPIPGAGDKVLSTRFTRVGVSLDLSWELDLWGRVRSGHAAALAEIQAAEDDLRAARESLAAQTAKAWFAAAEAHRQTELARTAVASYGNTTAFVRQRYEQGLRPAFDLRFALAEQASAEALLAQREEQLDRARRQLEILLGRYPAGAFKTAPDVPPLPPPVPAGLPADLVARRPDLAAAERRLAAAGARVDQSRAALYPRLALTASGGTSSDALRDLVDLDYSIWTLAANLTQPIFQGGRLRAGVDRAEAGARQALEAFLAAALAAYGEVETALAAEAFLARQERELATAAEQSTAARRLAGERYRAGVDSVLAWLIAQRRAIEAERQLITLRRLRLDNRVNLHLALGGGFEPETKEPSP